MSGGKNISIGLEMFANKLLNIPYRIFFYSFCLNKIDYSPLKSQRTSFSNTFVLSEMIIKKTKKKFIYLLMYSFKKFD